MIILPGRHGQSPATVALITFSLIGPINMYLISFVNTKNGSVENSKIQTGSVNLLSQPPTKLEAGVSLSELLW